MCAITHYLTGERFCCEILFSASWRSRLADRKLRQSPLLIINIRADAERGVVLFARGEVNHRNVNQPFLEFKICNQPPKCIIPAADLDAKGQSKDAAPDVKLIAGSGVLRGLEHAAGVGRR